MKCFVLAGGKGDRLWPLSRKNYPKQFIRIQNNHSIFQETIARNMAFCDEFVIITNQEYQFIVENQMKAFQGLTYRCIYEEVGRKTTAAIVLSALAFPMSEYIFVAASDHLIEGEGYRDNIIEAKELAKQGYLVTFGMEIEEPDIRFGYIHYKGREVLEFMEKPDLQKAKEYREAGDYYLNSGMFLFQNGIFLSELKRLSPYVESLCQSSFYMRKTQGSKTFYSREVMEGLPLQPIEKTLFEKTKKCCVVPGSFKWKDIGSLEDLSAIELNYPGNENVILNKCENTTVLNKCEDRLVVANQVEDLMIINTQDALYIGKNGESDQLKQIIRENDNHREFFEKGRIFYRNWGSYEILQNAALSGYQIRKVMVLAGKTIYLHMHENRVEHWCVVEGKATAIVGEKKHLVTVGDTLSIEKNTPHQISNTGNEMLTFIETATGISCSDEDMVRIKSRDLSEAQLGFKIEPFVLLKPAFKDYLWGGTRLREQFLKECDYDVIAESWELSAHPQGQSVVASGKYTGLLFGDYLKKIGDENLGWKYQSMRDFPLLIKLIDAKEDLSIQVHPGDDFALEHEHEYGKSEMWYIIDCEEGACIYCGFVKDVSKQEVAESIAEGKLLSLLNRIPIEKGRTYYIPAGTVHAIGKGSLICEIQQNSDSTYRIYDYDRVDKFGNKRRLDIEKAMQVMDFSRYSGFEPQDAADSSVKQEKDRQTCEGRVIGRCKYFECVLYQCSGEMELSVTEDSFLALMVLRGEGSLQYEENQLRIKKGDCIFIPKKDGRMQITGNCDFITSHI